MPERMPNGDPWPTITLVTPSLNQGDYIEETLRSVLLQGYPRLEYIVIDGGSSDGSVPIIQRYATHLAAWVSEPDRGQADAINKGMERATGEILAYLNSDDILLPDALARAALVLAKPGVDWVSGSCSFRSEEDGRAVVERPSEDPSIGRWLARLGGLPQPSTFWSRRMARTLGPFRADMHYAFDHEFWIRALTAGFRCHRIPALLAEARLHQASKTVSSAASWDADFREMEALYLPRLTVTERRRYHRGMLRWNAYIACRGLPGRLSSATGVERVRILGRELRRHHLHLLRPGLGMLKRLALGRALDSDYPPAGL